MYRQHAIQIIAEKAIAFRRARALFQTRQTELDDEIKRCGLDALGLERGDVLKCLWVADGKITQSRRYKVSYCGFNPNGGPHPIAFNIRKRGKMGRSTIPNWALQTQANLPLPENGVVWFKEVG